MNNETLIVLVKELQSEVNKLRRLVDDLKRRLNRVDNELGLEPLKPVEEKLPEGLLR